MIPQVSIQAQKLFVRALHLWTALFLSYCLTVSGKLWFDPVSPRLQFSGGPISWLVDLAYSMPLGFWIALPFCGIAAAGYSALRKPMVWTSVLIWGAYVILIARGWMVSTGGQQLVAIMLLWCIPLSLRQNEHVRIRQFASWAARLQLVLVYLSTFLHKLQGEDWLSGKALSVLASDPTFHLGFLQELPTLAIILTYVSLGFQLFFVVGIWFKAIRNAVLLIGVCFHLGTAYAVEIPDMALAFMACYTIWMSERTLAKLGQLVSWCSEKLRFYRPLSRQ